MSRTMAKGAFASVVLIAGLAAASPAGACLRTLQVRFEPDSAQLADKDAIASFLDVPTWGNGQLIAVRVSAPVHDLARRRAATLSDLLQAYGQSPSGIMIETNRDPSERAVLVVYPPPTVHPDPRFTQASPPAPTPTPPRTACGG